MYTMYVRTWNFLTVLYIYYIRKYAKRWNTNWRQYFCFAIICGYRFVFSFFSSYLTLCLIHLYVFMLYIYLFFFLFRLLLLFSLFVCHFRTTSLTRYELLAKWLVYVHLRLHIDGTFSPITLIEFIKRMWHLFFFFFQNILRFVFKIE